jgi:hypothetical protein
MQISLDLHETITNYNYHTNKGPIFSRLSLSESMYDLSYVAPLPGIKQCDDEDCVSCGIITAVPEMQGVYTSGADGHVRQF